MTTAITQRGPRPCAPRARREIARHQASDRVALEAEFDALALRGRETGPRLELGSRSIDREERP